MSREYQMEWPTISESLNRRTSDNAMNSDVGNSDLIDSISSEAKYLLNAGDQEMSDNPIDAELAGRVSAECGGGGLCLFFRWSRRFKRSSAKQKEKKA